MTPLSVAAAHRNAAVVRTLIEGGADARVTNTSGETPLHRSLCGSLFRPQRDRTPAPRPLVTLATRVTEAQGKARQKYATAASASASAAPAGRRNVLSPCLSLSLRLRLRHATPRSLHNPKIKREAWFVGLVVARFSYRYLYWRAGGGHVLCTRCMLEGLAVAMFSYVLFWRWPCSHYFSANGGRAHDTQTTPRKRREGDAGREPNKTTARKLCRRFPFSR